METINDSKHSNVKNKTLVNGNQIHVKQFFAQKMSIEDQFRAAVNVIRSLPKNGPFQPSDSLKLKFYAFYKQATDGPNDTKKPAFYDIVNKYKWEAWKKLGSMSRDSAMEGYIEELKKVVETMSFNESVSDFYEVLGPFHEFLPPESIESLQNSGHQLNGDNTEVLIDKSCDQEIIKIGKKSSKYLYKDTPRVNGEDEYGVDSEGEEFSDTYDHIGEDGQIPIAVCNGTDYSIDQIMEARGGADSSSSTVMAPNSSNNRSSSTVRPRNIRDARMSIPLSSSSANMRGSGGSGGGNGSNPQDYSIGINEQLALAVIRLQQSMDQVVNRLDTLESMLTRDSQSRSRVSRNKSSLWPFEDLRPHTIFLFMVWPFVAQYIVHYIRQKRRK